MKLNKTKRSLGTLFVLISIVTSIYMVGFSVLVQTAPAQAATIQIVPPSCTDEDGCSVCEIVKVFTNAADVIAAVLSGIALFMFIIGGFLLIFSAGQPDRIEKGKKVLLGTLTGLAIVFLAWFAVNVIVRFTASSGEASQTGVGTTSTLFGDNSWWDLSDCQPALPKSCKGLSIGQLCGFDGDSGCALKTGGCSCYRPLDPNGDDNVCGDDASTLSAASYKDKKCLCASQCTRVAQKTGKSYNCDKTAADVAAHPELYNVATGIVCTDSSKVCSVAN